MRLDISNDPLFFQIKMRLHEKMCKRHPQIQIEDCVLVVNYSVNISVMSIREVFSKERPEPPSETWSNKEFRPNCYNFINFRLENGRKFQEIEIDDKYHAPIKELLKIEFPKKYQNR